MIPRLILYRPITPDEARAASAWAEKLGDDRLTISYRPSPVPMRVLLFDATLRRKDGRPRQLVRRLDDPEMPVVAAMTEAMSSGDVVFNVFTGFERDRAFAWAETDAVFTVAFPEGEACAWFSRVQGGIAPGIAASCFRRQCRSPDLWNSVRFIFFKRMRNAKRRRAEDTVIAYARGLLAEVAVGG